MRALGGHLFVLWLHEMALLGSCPLPAISPVILGRQDHGVGGKSLEQHISHLDPAASLYPHTQDLASLCSNIRRLYWGVTNYSHLLCLPFSGVR